MWAKCDDDDDDKLIENMSHKAVVVHWLDLLPLNQKHGFESELTHQTFSENMCEINHEIFDEGKYRKTCEVFNLYWPNKANYGLNSFLWGKPWPAVKCINGSVLLNKCKVTIQNMAKTTVVTVTSVTWYSTYYTIWFLNCKTHNINQYSARRNDVTIFWKIVIRKGIKWNSDSITSAILSTD